MPHDPQPWFLTYTHGLQMAIGRHDILSIMSTQKAVMTGTSRSTPETHIGGILYNLHLRTT